MPDHQLIGRVLKIVKPFARNLEAFASAGSETRILADLKVSSARLVDIVLQIEEEFGIELGDEDAEQVRTIGDAVRVIEAKTGA